MMITQATTPQSPRRNKRGTGANQPVLSLHILPPWKNQSDDVTIDSSHQSSVLSSESSKSSSRRNSKKGSSKKIKKKRVPVANDTDAAEETVPTPTTQFTSIRHMMDGSSFMNEEMNKKESFQDFAQQRQSPQSGEKQQRSSALGCADNFGTMNAFNEENENKASAHINTGRSLGEELPLSTDDFGDDFEEIAWADNSANNPNVSVMSPMRMSEQIPFPSVSNTTFSNMKLDPFGESQHHKSPSKSLNKSFEVRNKVVKHSASSAESSSSKCPKKSSKNRDKGRKSKELPGHPAAEPKSRQRRSSMNNSSTNTNTTKPLQEQQQQSFEFSHPVPVEPKSPQRQRRRSSVSSSKPAMEMPLLDLAHPTAEPIALRRQRRSSLSSAKPKMEAPVFELSHQPKSPRRQRRASLSNNNKKENKEIQSLELAEPKSPRRSKRRSSLSSNTDSITRPVIETTVQLDLVHPAGETKVGRRQRRSSMSSMNKTGEEDYLPEILGHHPVGQLKEARRQKRRSSLSNAPVGGSQQGQPLVDSLDCEKRHPRRGRRTSLNMAPLSGHESASSLSVSDLLVGEKEEKKPVRRGRRSTLSHHPPGSVAVNSTSSGCSLGDSFVQSGKKPEGARKGRRTSLSMAPVTSSVLNRSATMPLDDSHSSFRAPRRGRRHSMAGGSVATCEPTETPAVIIGLVSKKDLGKPMQSWGKKNAV